MPSVGAQLLAAAWDSDVQGTLPVAPREIGKITAIDPRIVRKFLGKYPGTFSEVSGKLRNAKLCEQALKYKEISEKRSNAAQTRYPAIAEQKHNPASAPAFASSSANKGGYPLMPLSQDHADAKLHEPVFTLSEIDKEIGKLARRRDPSANGDQRTHLEAGIHRKRIGDAYFDATRAGIAPDDCVRDAISAGRQRAICGTYIRRMQQYDDFVACHQTPQMSWRDDDMPAKAAGNTVGDLECFSLSR